MDQSPSVLDAATKLGSPEPSRPIYNWPGSPYVDSGPVEVSDDDKDDSLDHGPPWLWRPSDFGFVKRDCDSKFEKMMHALHGADADETQVANIPALQKLGLNPSQRRSGPWYVQAILDFLFGPTT